MAKPKIKRALISVSNKIGLADLASQLTQSGIELIASGGTAQFLNDHHIPVREISDLTGFPEIMGARLKTLHPLIYGGILSRRGIDDEVMRHHDIQPIDLVIVNLYPFAQTIQQPDCTFAIAIEQIDIGGPTLLRAAAKNHQHVTVIVDPEDYKLVLSEIKQQGDTSLSTRLRLATKTFRHTALYDEIIANYFSQNAMKEQRCNLSETMTPIFHKQCDLRYGENPHQQAALYRQVGKNQEATIEQHQGKELSYNNFLDSDSAWNCVTALNPDIPACVIVKHATPCGAGQDQNLERAYEKAYATDPQSAFGGIIAVNKTIDSATALLMSKQFCEVIIAPDYHPDSLKIFGSKPDLRVISVKKSQSNSNNSQLLSYSSIYNGVLIQEMDRCQFPQQEQLKIVSRRSPTEIEIQDLLFAWQIVCFVKSNAIVYAKNQMALGIGTGQTSRVFSAQIAAQKAQLGNHSLVGAVMASDGFFPFADSIDIAKQIGISAIIQPGGSKRDSEVIAAVDQAGMTMVFTGTRHFRH